MGLSIVVLAFLVVCAINVLYFFFLLPFTFQKPKENTGSSKEGISVLVYIKNSEAILPDFLARLLALEEFSNNEFLFINHASYDETDEILENFTLNYPNTKLVNVENKEAFWASKRYAIALGIKNASHQKLTFISAETIFDDNNWLVATQQHFEKDFVIGYCNFSRSKSLGNRIARFYVLLQEIYHLGLLKLGKVAIVNDYNIGYSSDLFFENSGFNKQMNQYVGMQSLFYKDIGKTKNKTISKSNITRRVFSWELWNTHQLYRWRTFLKSSFISKALQTIFLVCQYAFWPLFILGCIYFPSPILFAAAGIRFVLFSLVLIKNGVDLNEKDTLYFYPIIELLSLFLGLYLIIRNISQPKTRYYF